MPSWPRPPHSHTHVSVELKSELFCSHRILPFFIWIPSRSTRYRLVKSCSSSCRQAAVFSLLTRLVVVVPFLPLSRAAFGPVGLLSALDMAEAATVRWADPSVHFL